MRLDARGSAPGRLDLLGGVADYSGALVLEIPTRLDDDGRRRARRRVRRRTGARSPVDEVADARRAPLPARCAPRSATFPKLDALRRRRGAGARAPRRDRAARGARSRCRPTCRSRSGCRRARRSRSRRRARSAPTRIDPLRLAALCQEAENQVVGAPCGIMDQVVVAMGTPGAVLPILCRPASVSPVVAAARRHRGGRAGRPAPSTTSSGAPYRRARAAAFMGKRIVEDATAATWSWVSELPRDAVGDASRDARRRGVPRPLGRDRRRTSPRSIPTRPIPCARRRRFGVEEHARSDARARCARHGATSSALGPLMAASHAGLRRDGPRPSGRDRGASTRRSTRPGVHGARSSGGGCGGTVVVVCDRGALDDVDGLVR